jgi:hypothetical protein
MVQPVDGGAILLRGLVLIDHVLTDAIDAYSALPCRTLKADLGRVTIAEKATIGCALGAISTGEYECIRHVNALRTDLRRRLDASVLPADESDVVERFKAKTALFSAISYDASAFPHTLAFVLVTLSCSLRLRAHRPDTRRSVADDPRPLEHIAAITLSSTIFEIARTGCDDDDPAVIAIVKRYAAGARALAEASER